VPRSGGRRLPLGSGAAADDAPACIQQPGPRGRGWVGGWVCEWRAQIDTSTLLLCPLTRESNFSLSLSRSGILSPLIAAAAAVRPAKKVNNYFSTFKVECGEFGEIFQNKRPKTNISEIKLAPGFQGSFLV